MFLPLFKCASTCALLLVLIGSSATAFSVQPVHQQLRKFHVAQEAMSTTHLQMFNKLSDAFKNDDSLGKRENAGLKNGPAYNENVTVNGIQVPGAVVGQKLTVVAGKVRVKIPVNCQQGDCGTCTVTLNGRKVKACQTILPSGKATIQTL